jgi:voltage-gated potassium channel
MDNSIRQRWYILLERPGHGLGRWLDFALIALILGNVGAAISETMESVAAEYADAFAIFETLSIIIFTIEYAARLWVVVEADGYTGWRGRLRYMATPNALVDLAAILPFYLTVFFSLDLRALRVLRLLRLFKLSRYSRAFSLLAEVFRRESATLLVCASMLCVLLIMTATGAYLVEREAQPVEFGSVPRAMWWAVVTLTTVGYGDVTPVTSLGRLFGGAVTIIGIGVAALPAGILASGLSSELSRRRQLLRDRFLAALKAGADGEAQLDKLRRELGLSAVDAEEVRLLHNRHDGLRYCSHCGQSLEANEGQGPDA